uniref:Fumarate hydratase class I n=1 Tax=Magnetococcus massalia (strain MO-1) TaxID=451514 RepID=A0A1S7LJB5_MAGMO|nr:Fumarate hydratase class I, aerobic [Candidatus Magnetococcus massalia]
MADFQHVEVLNPGTDTTKYRLLGKEHVRSEKFGDREMLVVEPEALTQLAQAAIRDVSHLFRTSHLEQVRAILDDPEASDNDRYVATELLKNASVSAGMVLPSCQDTGTATVMAKKGERVFTGGGDRAAIAQGVFRTYTDTNLRYSQVAPITLFDEKNTGTNLPAQIDIEAVDGDSYNFLFVTKGGGSANKTFLFQETKALLNPDSFRAFIKEKLKLLGTSACPPYHLGVVVGGTSPEMNMKTLKLATTRYLDGMPTKGSGLGEGMRDTEWEQEILKIAQQSGIGAQFGGKYFALDARVVRLPRHGASCPVSLGVSCSADRQIRGRIDKDGVWLEQLEQDPARFMPEVQSQSLSGEVVKVDLNKPMAEIRKELSQYPIKTRVMLSGPIVVARDIAHAKIKERLERGDGMPDYLQNHIVYYAGPAKTPEGYASGSFGPTTAGRMDSYVELFQSHGGSMVMLAKGNRSQQVTDACNSHGGFYLGSIGGVAAQLAQESIRKVEVIDYAELGMEAVYRIEVEDFPAFIIVDDKGNDFFA